MDIGGCSCERLVVRGYNWVMRVVLYMATSINGLVTRGEDDSDWVAESDWDEFYRLAKETGIIVMGRRTYEIFGDEFPVKEVVNVVMTGKSELIARSSDVAIFSDATPSGVLELADQKGFKEILLVGGTELNTSFFQEDLVDEVYLSVHPVVFARGLPLIGEIEYEKQLELLGVKEIAGGLVQLHYKVER